MTQLSPEARALIERVGDADGPSAPLCSRLTRAVSDRLLMPGSGVPGPGGDAGAVTGVGSSTTAQGAVASGLAAKALTGAGTQVGLWVAMGFGLALATAVPVVLLRGGEGEGTTAVVESRPVTPAPSIGARTARVSSTAEQRRVELEAEAAAVRAQSHTSPSVPRRSSASLRSGVLAGGDRGEPTPVVPLAAPAPSVPAISQEMRLLEVAQRELSAQRASAALVSLQEHARRFPSGALSQEREAVRILALCQLGRQSEARRAAKVFLRSAGASPLVPRIRESCAMNSDISEMDSLSPQRLGNGAR